MISKLFLDALYAFATLLFALFNPLPEATLPGFIASMVNSLAIATATLSPFMDLPTVLYAVTFFVAVLVGMVLVKFLTWIRHMLPVI